MKSLKGSNTESNLVIAFCGESQARNKYTFFSKKAKKEGFIQIANIFEETANQEKEHAKVFFKFLEGGEVVINSAFPAGSILTTLENLIEASKGENYENTILYPKFAKIAKKEGFDKVSMTFEAIIIAEKQHEKRYLELANNIEKGKVFKKNTSNTWRCLNCGYISTGNEPPKKCPACSHPQSYFEILSENW